MARNRKSSGFTAIRIEGGILPPEFLAVIAGCQAKHQAGSDYGLTKSLSLKDELARYWRIAGDLYTAYAERRDRVDVNRVKVGVDDWLLPLLKEVLGFDDLSAVRPVTLGDRTFPITHQAFGGMVPMLLTTREVDLDRSDPRFGEEGRRRALHGLMQELLNASDDALWGIIANGAKLRLLRDNPSLTRPAYIEADLDLIFAEELYPDFAALWLLAHASRLKPVDGKLSNAILERWRAEAHETGERALDHLREGVTEALKQLGNGFLQHPENEPLRAALADGRLSAEGYFQELLRLVYRLLFLFTAEERNLLHLPTATDEQRAIYAQGYSLARLRERAGKRRHYDRHHDLWQGLKIVFRALASGEPRLALPALGGLFAPEQCPALEAGHVSNERLLEAIRALSFFRTATGLARVNYRDMGTEELGSVYESLLELHPVVDVNVLPWQFGFAGETNGKKTKGSERKLSGSYYTPAALVNELIKSALEPVMAEAVKANPADPRAALLSLKILDPACGSGHFLLAAARRLAAEIARIEAGSDTPDEAARQHALREVVQHCIYGVDRNPLAVELCRTALWIETIEPGKPLSFLDHHLQCGDALLGVLDPFILDHGLPDEAFAALTGDDKTVAAEAKKRNKQERASWQRALATGDLFRAEHLAERTAEVDHLADDDLAAVAAKARAWQAARDDAAASRLARLADLYVGAFLLPKTAGHKDHLPSSRHLWAVAHDEPEPSLATVEAAARAACEQARVLHWWIAFPHIASQGGFDVVLGNPPWERIKLQEEEFFAAKSPSVAQAINKAERARRIEWLRQGRLQQRLDGEPHSDQPPSAQEQALYREFEQARRTAEAASGFVHAAGGRYPLTGVGDVNTYALFAETFTQLLAPTGRAGLIVPTGIATDDSTKAFFAAISEKGRLVSLFDFENSEGVFPGVHRSYKFCLLTLGEARAARFVCFATDVAQLADARRQFTLTPEEFALLNPNTRTCPVFRSGRDAELTKKLYRAAPVLIREEVMNAAGEVIEPEINPWGIRFQTMFHMSNDSGLFLTDPAQSAQPTLPLYEAKMIHQFDHRWAAYPPGADESGAQDVPDAAKADPRFTVRPRYWVSEREVLARIARVPRAVAKAWLALHQAADPAPAQEARAALWRALAAWVAGELFRRIAGPPAGDGSYRDGQTLRAAQEVEQRLAAGYPACAAALAEAGITGKKAVTEFAKWARQDTDTPLSDDELAVLRAFAARAPNEARDQALAAELDAWMDARSPRWLMGWRDITNATNERTVIASVLPRVGVGNNLPLMLFGVNLDARRGAALLGNLCSLVLDFVARHKVGGTHMNYFIYKQLPILPPDRYTPADLDFIVPRVLELTYTAHDLAAWAADLGHTGAPFPWNPERRAQLRAELDAYYARLYGLRDDELRYVLDPAEVEGPDYPSETFRVLKNNELRLYGEYRTRRLVLEAWDRLERGELFAPSPTIRIAAMPTERVDVATLPDGAWTRPMQDPRAETGAQLAAILKAMKGPLPARQVRLAVLLALEPRLLLPYLDEEEAENWRRLIGPEAYPLPPGTLSFIARADAAWGAAVRHLRANGHLVEDLQASTWAPGAGLDRFATAGWPDGRAKMVLRALQRQATDTVLAALPAELRDWVDAAAA
ncbi:MAG: Eco57I restriction-modification methylase domain-containing protein [Pseudomonadota bacterium]